MAALRFLSLEAIREHHNGLLDERADMADDDWSDEFLERIAQFVQDIAEAGAVLEGYEKRSAAQRVLDYWIDQTFRVRRNRDLGKPTLAPFDAARAVAAEDLPDDAFPFRVLGETPEHPEDLLPSRHKAASECVDLLLDGGLAILVGPRASGRSGVASAGVVPLWLRRSTGDAAARGAAPRDFRWYDRPQDIAEIAADLATGPGETLVVIDHVEDVVSGTPEQAEAWLESLSRTLTNSRGNLRFLLVVRRDAFHHFEESAHVGPLIASCSVMVPPLEARELTEVIESRAKQVRLWFARGLVDQLVSDILGDPGALPWLRVALRGLWVRRERNRITWDAYDQMGGARLLEQGLENYYEYSSPDEQARIERLLKRLVLPGLREEAFQCVRVAEADLVASESDPAAMTDTIDALIECGLLSRSGPTIRVVHESFVPRWRRLTHWLAGQRELLEELLRLIDAAISWRDSNQNVGALWIDQTLINEAIKSLGRAADIELAALPVVTRESLTLAREFLARSQQYVNWRETLRRLRLAVATVAACVFGGLWLLSEYYRDQAIVEQQAAERALGRAHRAERERILSEDDLSGALELLNDTARHHLARNDRQPEVEERSSGLIRNQLLTPAFLRLLQARGPSDERSSAAPSGNGGNSSEDYGAWIATTISANGAIIVECYQKQLTVHRLAANGQAEARTLVDSIDERDAGEVKEVPRLNGQAESRRTDSPTVEYRSAAVSADGRTIVAEVVKKSVAPGTGMSVEERAVLAWRDVFSRNTSDRVQGVRLRLEGFESIQLATAGEGYGGERGDASRDGAWLLVVAPSAVRNDPSANARELQVWQLNATGESAEPRIVARREIDMRSQEQIVISSLFRFASFDGSSRYRVAAAIRDPAAGPAAPLEVRIWDIRTDAQSGELSRPFVLSTDCTNITSLTWCPSNERILAVAGSRAGDRVELWRVDCSDDDDGEGTARPLASPQRVQPFTDSRVLAFCGDGSTFAVGSKDAAILWRMESAAETGRVTPRFLHRLPHEADVFSIAFSPDGRWLATGGRDRTARLWNVNDGQPIGAPLRHTEVVAALAFDREASFLTTMDANFSSGDRTVRVWPLESGNPPPLRIVGVSPDSLPVLSPDGRAIVRFAEYAPLADRSNVVQGTPRLERFGQPAMTRELDQARSARFSGNGEYLLTWQDPTPKAAETVGDMLWEFRVYGTQETPQASSTSVILPRIPGPGPWRWAEAVAPTAIAVSNGGDRVAVAFAHGAGLTDRNSQGVVWVWSRGDASSTDRTPSGQWDSWVAWRAAARDDEAIHRSPIVSMAFSPTGDTLATASTDDTVCIWSSDRQEPRSLHLDRNAVQRLRHGADVNDVRFVGGGHGMRAIVMVTASSDGKLRIWPYVGRLVAKDRVRECVHRAPVQLGLVNHDGSMAISAGGDGRVKVWNAATGELMAVLLTGRDVRGLAVAAEGTIRTVCQTPGALVPPPKPVFATGWSPVGGGAQLSLPVSVQAWNSRVGGAPVRGTEFERLLAARRFSRNGRLVDMTPVDYANRWRDVRRSLPDASVDALIDRERLAPEVAECVSRWERLARDVAECISRKDWYAARWHLERWPTDEQAGAPPASTLAAKILRAHVQAAFAAQQFDGRQACREFTAALAHFDRTLQDPLLSHSDKSALWLRRGWLNERLGKWGDAQSDYGRAIETAKDGDNFSPNVLSVWYRRRGTCLAEREQFAAAAADFEHSWRLAKPDYLRSYDQLYCLALLALHTGKPEDRDAYARRCTELVAGHRRANSQLTAEDGWTPSTEAVSANTVASLCALADVRQLNPDEALTLARRAVELNPDDYYSQSTLGGCRYRQAMRLGPLRSALAQARADLLAARMKYMARRQTQAGSDSTSGGVVQDDGTPYDWLFLAMATWQIAELDRADPKAQRNTVATDSLRVEARFWLEKARQQLRVPTSLPRAAGRLPCSPATGWAWWQRMEMNLLLTEAEAMFGETVTSPTSR